MKKVVNPFKSVCFKALVICSCLSVFAASAAFAQTEEPATQPAVKSEAQTAPGAGSQSFDGYDSKALRDKHMEVDQFIFKKHQGDFSEKGFKVTNTGPVNGKIEIGITPYTEDNAKYLYGVFGTELVKVVEGIQAVPLKTPESAAGQAAAANDSPVMATAGAAGGEHAVIYKTTGEPKSGAMEAVSAPYDTVALKEPAAESRANSSLMVIGAIMLAGIVTGGAAFAIRKQKTAK